MMVGRGRTTASPNDTGSVQMLQLTLGPLETRDGTPRLAEFGFTSAPPVGSDAVLVFFGGNRKTGVVIATGNQATRPKGLLPGEVMIYDAFGKSIYLSQENGIVINANGAPLAVNNASTAMLNSSGDVTINSPQVSTSEVFQAGNGVSGNFTSEDGKSITVEKGIVTGIS